MTDKPEGWIEKLEIPDAQIKWAWSHIAGEEDTYNEKGQHNLIIILPERDARELAEIGWGIKEVPGYEEGDPPEFHLKAHISYRFEDPKVYLIKGQRKFRADREDLKEIRRDSTERIDIILNPSRWVNGNRTGVSAYVEEMYAVIKESRFGESYADYEEVK